MMDFVTAYENAQTADEQFAVILLAYKEVGETLFSIPENSTASDRSAALDDAYEILQDLLYLVENYPYGAISND